METSKEKCLFEAHFETTSRGTLSPPQHGKVCCFNEDYAKLMIFSIMQIKHLIACML